MVGTESECVDCEQDYLAETLAQAAEGEWTTADDERVLRILWLASEEAKWTRRAG